MRRVRQTAKELSPPFSRMFAAVALSAALHVVLIYGFSLPVISDSGTRLVIISAWVKPAHSSAIPRRSKPPERSHASDVFQPAAQPSFAGQSAAEPAAAPLSEGDPLNEADPLNERDHGVTEPVSLADDPTRLTVPDPVDYLAKDLDIYPRPLEPIAPAYPQARDAQRGGYVTLQVSIDETGRVVASSVLDAAPEGIFEQAALRALTDTTFYPARKDGHVVRSRILVKVEFDPAMPDVAQ